MLTVDYRAGSKELVAPLMELGLPVDVGTLDSADVAFVGKGEGGTRALIGVEYKKLPELIASIRSERFHGEGGQVPRMQEAYDFIYVLIEGEIWVSKDGMLMDWKGSRKKEIPGRMTLTELRKRLFSLLAGRGLVPLWSVDQNDTCHILSCLYRNWTDTDRDRHPSLCAVYNPPSLERISEYRAILQRFRGVGPELSRAIEKHFRGDLEKTILAGEAEWVKIPGVGKGLARHIRSIVRGERYGQK
jgi:ERCC4-type nuclease